jgi:hypothetical protein
MDQNANKNLILLSPLVFVPPPRLQLTNAWPHHWVRPQAAGQKNLAISTGKRREIDEMVD